MASNIILCKFCGVEIIKKEGRGGIPSICGSIECRKARKKQYYIKHMDANRSYFRKYRKNHREKYVAYSKKYNAENWKTNKDTLSEKNRESYNRYKKARLEKSAAAYRSKNPECSRNYNPWHNLTQEQRGEKKRLWSKCNNILRRAGHKLLIGIIQSVYEDNIKKYGTLTCYLCSKKIVIGDENLEHKTPISRGGTNSYENLAISCVSCNKRKGRKTLEEFAEMQKKRKG